MSRTAVAVIVALIVAAGAWWFLRGQRPYEGRPVADLVVAPELGGPGAPAAPDDHDLVVGFEALTVLLGEGPVPEGPEQLARYTRALRERFPESGYRALTPEVSLAGWVVAPSQTSGGRLSLVLCAKARPARDLSAYIHCLGDEKTLPLFPEYWRTAGMFASVSAPGRALSSLAPGDFVVASFELPRLEGELAVRVGLMGAEGETPVIIGRLWHGAPRTPVPPPRGPSGSVEVRRGDSTVVTQPVTLAPGFQSIPIGRGSSDTARWDRIGLTPASSGDGPACLVRFALRDDASRAAAQGRFGPGGALFIDCAGSPFERGVRRWRYAAPVGAAALGALAFVAFGPSALGRGARYLAAVAASVMLLRLFMVEDVQDGTQWWTVVASDFLIAGLAVWLATKAGCAAGLIRCERDPAPLALGSRWKSFVVLLVILAAPMLAWFIGEWPGHPYYDESIMLDAALKRQTQPWLSTVFSVYAVSIMRVIGQYTAIAVVNIVVVSWVLADFFSLVMALGVRRLVAGVFVAILATSIPLALLAINMSHDIITAFLKIALVVAVLKMFVRSALLGGTGGTPRALRGAGALVLLAALLRGENMALLAYVPLMLLVTRQARPLAVLGLVVCLAAGTAGYRALAPRVEGPTVKAGDAKERYLLYLLYGPVGFMVTNNYYTPTPAEDRAAISAAIHYDQLVAHYSAFNFLDYAYWTTPYVTKDILRGFKRVYVTSALNNPGLYVANRLLVVMRCIEGNPYNYLPFRYQRETYSNAFLFPAPGLENVFIDQGMAFDREDPSALASATRRVRDWSQPAGFKSPGYYIWNGLPALAVALGGLFLFRRLPMTSALCGIIVSALVLLTIAVPAAHFKYLTDTYVFGFLVVPIALLEAGPLRRLRAGRAGTVVS